MKKAESEAARLSSLVDKGQREIERLCSQISEIKSGYEKAMNVLKVKEIFVSGGLTENDYQGLVSIISKTDKEDMLALATNITKLIQSKTKKGEL